MTVGQRLKRLRMKKRLTQEELGDMLGITKGAIQKYESGKIKNFKVETVRKLSTIFDIPPAYFIFDKVPAYRFENTADILSMHYGDWMPNFLANIEILNEKGREKLRAYVEDLALIGKYKREDA